MRLPHQYLPKIANGTVSAFMFRAALAFLIFAWFTLAIAMLTGCQHFHLLTIDMRPPAISTPRDPADPTNPNSRSLLEELRHAAQPNEETVVPQ